MTTGSNTVSFTDPPTGAEAPPAQEPVLTGDAKALADTKAALTKAQQELAELKKGSAPAAPETPAADTPAEGADPAKETPKVDELTVPETADVDLTPFTQEYAEKGDLSEESRKAVAKTLFPNLSPEIADKLISDYVEAAKVRDGVAKTTADNQTADLMKSVGGEEAYKGLIGWAATALTQSEKEAFNRVVTSGDPAAAAIAIEGLNARFAKANGRSPDRRVQGDSIAPVGVKGYSSNAEMAQDMKDPRYTRGDKDFHAHVKARLAAT